MTAIVSSGTSAVLATLETAYTSHGPLDSPARPVIGTVGQDVPAEVIIACKATPLRLRGDPAAATDRGDHYLGTGLDPSIRSLLSLLLDERFGRLDGLVVSSDCDASLRLFYALREIARVEPSTHIPPVTLVDVLHLPRATTTAYNRVRIGQFAAVVQEWTGTRLAEDALAEAITASDETRELQSEVSRLRHHVPAKLTGSEFLAVMGAQTRLPADEYRQLLTTLLAEAKRLPEHNGLRLFLTGSNHDNPGVYRAIEAAGAVIVGEDHDWGQLLAERQVGTHTLDALAERYQYNGPTAPRASIRERAAHTARAAGLAAADALVGYARDKDDAPLWDFAMQRRAVGMPAAIIARQPYGQIEPNALTETLRSLRQPEDAA